jgi:uncharacterized protein
MLRGTAAALVLAVGLSAQLGCGDSDGTEADTTPSLQGGTGAGAAATGSGAGGASSGSNAGSNGGSGPVGGAAAGGASGMAGAAGTASGSDAGITPPEAPCDPSAGGKVSSPGQYQGYGEALYDGNERSSLYVPVRDGTRLAIDVFRPTKDGQLASEPLPVLFMHTPYNRRTFTTGPTAETYPGFALRLVQYGYVVAVADFRGLYASFGTNVAFNRGEWIDAARMDAYDLIEWLAKQPWSSGKVGMWGCSATGGSQLQAATTAPPSLKAIFPMSCEFDVYPFGVPGGVARASGNTSAPPMSVPGALRDAAAAAVDGADASLLSQAIGEHASNIDNAGFVPFRDSLSPSLSERWWLKSSPHTYHDMLRGSGVAIYAAANWNEGMTKYGAFFTFNNLPNTKMVIGPAGHCEWTKVKDDTGFDIVIEERRFFDRWLKDVENCVMREPPVYYYTYNAPAGREWRAASAWPLPEEQRTHYYFGEGVLSTQAPPAGTAADEAQVEYGVTPANRATKGLLYASEPLAEDLQVTGHPVVELWVASTATDGDFVVTLEDLAPDGTATSYFMEGRLRASHRALEDAPYDNLGLPWHPFTEAAVQPLVPGEPALLSFDLQPLSIVFAKGHRIRVVLTFADAATAMTQPAPTVTVHRNAEHASRITLPEIH